MVECGADEIPEDVMVAALELGHKSIQPLIELQLKMAAESASRNAQSPL